jgi:hypothetical protein
MNIASLPVVTAYATTCHPVVFRRDSLAMNQSPCYWGSWSSANADCATNAANLDSTNPGCYGRQEMER